MKKSFEIHPFLFALYPILFLYSQNVYQVSYSEILLPLAITLGFSLLLVLLFRSIFRNGEKAAIIVSMFLVLFFSYGHVYALITDWYVIKHIYILIAWGTLYTCGVYLTIRTHRELHNFTSTLNVVALSLCVVSFFNIGVHEFKTRVPRDYYKSTEDKSIKETILGNDETLRDIYYIILDGYASSSTLKEIYGYDNHKFSDYLTEKGFYVASESRSNYPLTFQSLSSSLNMKYVNDLTDVVGINSVDRTIPYQLIEHNEVIRFLKSKGYMFINFGSGWGATDRNSNADLDWHCSRWTEFLMIFIQTTMLNPLERYAQDARGRVLCTFSELAKVNRIEGPKFVFAHIISPHPPFLFDANGDPVPKADLEMSGYVWAQKENYLNQLIFVNEKVKMMVDEILTNSDVPPIIILQADHGSASTFPDTADISGWDFPTEIMLKERMRIFNAYYLPSGGDHLLYESITPVNTFRLIFNHYFTMSYEILSDRSYYSTYRRPYEFIDVTDIVKYR